MKKNPNIVPSGLSISALASRLTNDPDNVGLQHRMMEARLERSIELGIQVSVEDAELLYSHTWGTNNSGYAVTLLKVPKGTGNTGHNKEQFSVPLQRLVLSRMLECQPWDIPADLDADHVDEELGKLNCTRDNIQPLSKMQNAKKARNRSKLNAAYAILRGEG